MGYIKRTEKENGNCYNRLYRVLSFCPLIMACCSESIERVFALLISHTLCVGRSPNCDHPKPYLVVCSAKVFPGFGNCQCTGVSI